MIVKAYAAIKQNSTVMLRAMQSSLGPRAEYQSCQSLVEGNSRTSLISARQSIKRDRFVTGHQWEIQLGVVRETMGGENRSSQTHAGS